MRPDPTARLAFRDMADSDLDDMARLLGDPRVMRYYPRPKTRDEAGAWIDWSRASYSQHGHGLWVIETHDGEFVGDCGLTWQLVDGEQLLEVGYHLLPEHQGHGYAAEAARACVEFAFRRLGAEHVVAIINPDNAPSRRVAERIGMSVEVATSDKNGLPVVVYGRRRNNLPGA